MSFRLPHLKIKERIEKVKQERLEKKKLEIELNKDAILKGELVEKLLGSEEWDIIKEVMFELSDRYEMLADENDDLKYIKMKQAFRDLKGTLHSMVEDAKNLTDLAENKDENLRLR